MKEQDARERWLKDSVDLLDLKDVHRWLHQTHRCVHGSLCRHLLLSVGVGKYSSFTQTTTGHRCYAVARQNEASLTAAAQDARLLASY